MTSQLIPLEPPYNLAVGTFVRVDARSIFDHETHRLVGTIIGLYPHSLTLEHPDSHNTTAIDFEVVEAIFYAPMGYRV